MIGKIRQMAAPLAAALVSLIPAAARADEVYLSGGQLVVYGSPQDDLILATEDLAGGTVTVTISDLSFNVRLRQTFPRAQVSRIYLNPLDGDDCAANNTSLPSSMEGWSGEDTLLGGSGPDDLWGDSAAYKDLTGDDYVAGNAGNDTLHGGPGADQIYGGDGDDTIWPDGGDDYVDGGAGNNSMHITCTQYVMIQLEKQQNIYKFINTGPYYVYQNKSSSFGDGY